MADETPRDEELQRQGEQTSEETSSSNTSQEEKEEQQRLQDWWKEAQERGFKKEEDVWKSYREAEKKITEMGEELKTYRKFEQDVAPVLEAIWGDEELLNKVKAKLSGQNPVQNLENKESGNKKEGGPAVDPEARKVLAQKIIEEFEREKGIVSLDEESKKEIRRKIGREMAKWVDDPKNIPLDRLPALLEDAFIVAANKDDSLKKMLSEISDRQEKTDRAAMPSTSSAGSSEGEIQLTPEQRKVAERMPGGVEAYIRGLKKLKGYGVTS